MAVGGAMLAGEEGEESGANGRSGKRALERVVVVGNSEMAVDTSTTEVVGEEEGSGKEVRSEGEEEG